MAPGDLFLGFRHFFGYVIPGGFWTCAAILAVGETPDQFTNWREIAVLAVASYVVGFCLHGPIFRKIIALDRRLSARAVRGAPSPDVPSEAGAVVAAEGAAGERAVSSARDAAAALIAQFATGQPQDVQDYLKNLSDDALDEYCKRYVVAHSERLAEEFKDLEGTINFITGVAPGLVALAIGLVSYSCINRVPWPQRWWFIAAAATSALLAMWMVFVRLRGKRENERHHWHRAFIIVACSDRNSTEKSA